MKMVSFLKFWLWKHTRIHSWNQLEPH